WLDQSGAVQPILPPARYYGPRLSPDGTRLAIEVLAAKRRDLWVHDLRSGGEHRLTLTTTRNFAPAWAPDGKHLIFPGRDEAGYGMWWARADGAGQPQRLLTSPSILVTPYSISPNGRLLSYSELAAVTVWDAWILPLNFSDPEHPEP